MAHKGWGAVRRGAIVAAAAIALVFAVGGCGWNRKKYVSASPEFAVHYPASWHVSSAADEYGPKTIFSPDSEVGRRSPRVTLQVTAAEPRSRPEEGLAAPNVVVEAPVGLTTEGLAAHRWLVTMYPSAVLVEAYAPPDRFDTIRSVAESMVEELRDTSRAGSVSADTYRNLVRPRTMPWGRSR